MDRAGFLDVALAIGRRIAREALWDGPACTWEIVTPEREAPGRRATRRRAGPGLYQGTAGIAFFLGELGRATGDPEVGRAAGGALAHALGEAEELAPASFGFHSGRLGVAWTAARLAEIFELPEHAAAARRLLAPLRGRERLDRGLDVIDGAGGAIPALLELAGKLSSDELLETARELGDYLIDRAHREPGGWAWSSAGSSAVRCLTGLAHGASGMGLALLELARATGCGRCRFAAEMAFLYERRWFSEEQANWPDLRHEALGDYLFRGRLDELREAVQSRTLAPYRLDYMTAWCHGAPGIGLARLRAWEITGQAVYRREAEAALASTLASIRGERLERDNFSLCHGIAGNCELALRGAELLGDPGLAEAAFRAAAHGAETYEATGRGWPCGTVGSARDPSLMVGEAGIGAFYLRLADPEVPPVLLLRPTVPEAPCGDVAADFEALARETADESFGTARRVFERLASTAPAPPLSLERQPLERTPVEAAYARLAAACAVPRDEARRRLLEDAFLPEKTRYELTLGLTDFTAAYLRGLTRPAWEDVDAVGSQFVLVPGGALVTTEHDWEAWLEDGGDEPPPESEVDYFLYPEADTIGRQRTGPLAALVLDAAAEAAPFDEIVGHVAAALEGAGAVDREALAAKVLAQLEELYRRGFVEVAPSSVE